MRFMPQPATGEWNKGDRVVVNGKIATIENGTMELRYYTMQIDGIEFNEELSLYRVKIYDSVADKTHKRFVIAESIDEGLAIAKAYYEDEGWSVVGIQEIDIVIGRQY